MDTGAIRTAPTSALDVASPEDITGAAATEAAPAGECAVEKSSTAAEEGLDEDLKGEGTTGEEAMAAAASAEVTGVCVRDTTPHSVKGTNVGRRVCV